MSNDKKPDAQVSIFGNFVIHHSTSNEGKSIDGQQSQTSSENIADPKASKDVAKGAKRAPLAACQINCSENAAHLPDQTRLQQVPAKKRAECFQIFVDHNSPPNEKTTNEQENTENRQLLLSPLPGKENVEPPPAGSSEVLKEKEFSPYGPSFGSGGPSFGSGTDEEEDEEEEEVQSSPSEYLTAKSSLTFLSAKRAPIVEKNAMYLYYDKDIYDWMLYRERLFRPRPSYMAKQSELTEDMRAVLLDWFVDVIGEFELSAASFFLAVSLTDRTLSVIDCPRDKLQLLGATSILIATKIHEIFPPLIKDIVYVTDDSYSEEQVRKMEKVVLKCVDFQLTNPLIDSFAEFFNHFAPIPLATAARHLMCYLLELSTLNFYFIRFLPSRLAAAAFFLATHHQQAKMGEANKEEKIWTTEMAKQTKITRKELRDPVAALIKSHRASVSSKVQSVRKKFAASRRCKVSSTELPEFEELASQFTGDD